MHDKLLRYPYWSRIQPELDPNPTRTSFCIYQTVIEENMPSVRDEVSEEWKDKLGVKVVPPLFLSNFCFFTSTKLSCLFPTKMMDEAFHRCCYCWCWKIIFTKITIFRWECQRPKLIVILLSTTINNYSILIYILVHSILVSCKNKFDFILIF